MNLNKPPLWVIALPPTLVAILFGAAQLLTTLGCRGFESNCGYHWFWLALWPMFIVSSLLSLTVSLVLAIIRYKK